MTEYNPSVNETTAPNHKKSLWLRLKQDPYWLSIIPQLIVLAIISTSIIWGTGVLSFFTITLLLLTIALPIRRAKQAYQQALEKDKGAQFKTGNFSIKRPPAISFFLPDRYSLEEERERSTAFYFDFWIYIFHAMHFIIFLSAIYVVSTTNSYLAALMLALIFYVISPQIEAISHEFIHRRSYFQQMLGGSIWATFCYGTFLAEHCMGHHVHVSTPEDPSSAPKNMTLYQFLPRAMILNPINGFKLEAKRLRDRDINILSIHNRLIWLSLFSLSLMLLCYLAAGGPGLVFFVVQTLVCILTIEVANYGMHYGLERNKLDNGRYERVSPLHSWNREGPGHIISANLIRHSDHHAFPRRPYQNLRLFKGAPQLPIPYQLVLALPFVPKLWFSIMNPFVEQHMEKLQKWRDEGIDDYQEVMGMDGDRIAGN